MPSKGKSKKSAKEVKEKISKKINEMLGLSGDDEINFTRLSEIDLLKLYDAISVLYEKTKLTISKQEIIERVRRRASEIAKERPLVGLVLSLLEGEDSKD